MDPTNVIRPEGILSSTTNRVEAKEKAELAKERQA